MSYDRSFVPPVRDEESETQRKAHAKRVRETRRSTQGVTLDEIKSAEQLVKKKAGNGTAETPSTKKPEESPIPSTPDNGSVSNTKVLFSIDTASLCVIIHCELDKTATFQYLVV